MKFEQAYNKLEKILNDINNENYTIDELVNLFDKANKLSTICQDELKKAEKKISVITEENNKIRIKKI